MWIGQCTSRARPAHPCDVGVHARPVKSEADAMEGAIRVKMSADGVSMYYVAKLRWDELQSSVRFRPDDCFPINQNAILNGDERLAQGRRIVGIEF